MKRNLLSISIICALLGFFLILFGSVAYYSTTKTGNVTSTTKKISFDVYHNNKQIETINLYDTIEEKSERSGEVIIPGDKGKFELVVLGTGSEVNIKYEIKLTGTEVPTNMNFYVDEKTANNLINITDHTIEGTMKVGESMTKNHTIYWEWPYDNGEANQHDYNYQGKTFNISISAIGIQTID